VQSSGGVRRQRPNRGHGSRGHLRRSRRRPEAGDGDHRDRRSARRSSRFHVPLRVPELRAAPATPDAHHLLPRAHHHRPGRSRRRAAVPAGDRRLQSMDVRARRNRLLLVGRLRQEADAARLHASRRPLPDARSPHQREGAVLRDARQQAGLELTGTHHRGIDDARNIARLLPLAVGAR
jgi:hypothetical protein